MKGKTMKAQATRLVTPLVLAAAWLVSSSSSAEPITPERIHDGRAKLYQQLSPTSLENTTTSARIRAVTSGNVAPTEIWRALEHGEKVECLSCIPLVAKLLYDRNAKTREISAWWLRRRIFGVFGEGQTYSRVVATLNGDPSETRRAYAAEALGEFMSYAGVKHVARAITTDASSVVKISAARALERLNNEGLGGELGQAIAAPGQDEEVVWTSMHAAARINVFTGVDSIVGQIGSPSARIRKKAAEVLGRMRAADAVVGLIALTSEASESDPGVRKSAVAALGEIGDPAAADAVTAAQSDSDGFVRDAANVAIRRF